MLFRSVRLLSAFPSCMWICLICLKALSALPMSGSSASASRNATQRNGRGRRVRCGRVPTVDQAALSRAVALSTIPTYAMDFIQRDYDCGLRYVQSLGFSTTQWDSMAAFSICYGFRTTWYPNNPYYPPKVWYTGMFVSLEQWTFSNGIHSDFLLISPEPYHLISWQIGQLELIKVSAYRRQSWRSGTDRSRTIEVLETMPRHWACMWTCLICLKALSALPMSGSSASTSRNATAVVAIDRELLRFWSGVAGWPIETVPRHWASRSICPENLFLRYEFRRPLSPVQSKQSNHF